MNDEDIDYSNLLHCVDELAKRWWYALPAWPPENYDYDLALKKVGMRQLDPSEFRMAPEIDHITRLKKVYPIEYFEGIFKDSEGNTYDLRPKESMPCLTNFQRKSIGELRSLLIQAYSNQLSELVKVKAENKQYDRQMEEQIMQSLHYKMDKL